MKNGVGVCAGSYFVSSARLSNLCAATLPRRNVYLQEIMDRYIAGVILLAGGTIEAERRLLLMAQTSSELKVVGSHSYVLSVSLPHLYPFLLPSRHSTTLARPSV